ncbi:hypothetical protein PF010_g31556 [Phytophthora fragariae]|uniref:Uncharacterized protein n=1 Tax=Phytophthora fragariae TaxID=53985 RepID=A0A6A3PRY6_9STRA|nr:hypothetical protein PF009_g32095 [Phytophthora fragariae]KAE9056970.1 hypothetical protein PF010_g31556 [Phytophthora fragariae]KAE9059858.1 hypothetical protein PF006_g31780 [Phytophthora fragariae]KAE9263299.1 hypothetical protein PF001_g31737 [Phytophthora fragariae]
MISASKQLVPLIARIGLTIVKKNSTAVVMTNAMYNGFRWSKHLCPT